MMAFNFWRSILSSCSHNQRYKFKKACVATSTWLISQPGDGWLLGSRWFRWKQRLRQCERQLGCSHDLLCGCLEGGATAGRIPLWARVVFQKIDDQLGHLIPQELWLRGENWLTSDATIIQSSPKTWVLIHSVGPAPHVCAKASSKFLAGWYSHEMTVGWLREEGCQRYLKCCP